jgi:hypothetical protein
MSPQVGGRKQRPAGKEKKHLRQAHRNRQKVPNGNRVITRRGRVVFKTMERLHLRHLSTLNISQPYRPPRPVTGIAFFTLLRRILVLVLITFLFLRGRSDWLAAWCGTPTSGDRPLSVNKICFPTSNVLQRVYSQGWHSNQSMLRSQHVQECALLSTWTTCNFPVRIKP